MLVAIKETYDLMNGLNSIITKDENPTLLFLFGHRDQFSFIERLSQTEPPLSAEKHCRFSVLEKYWLQRTIFALFLATILAFGGVPAQAQWLNVPAGGIPKTKEGKPNLTAERGDDNGFSCLVPAMPG